MKSEQEEWGLGSGHEMSPGRWLVAKTCAVRPAHPSELGYGSGSEPPSSKAKIESRAIVYFCVHETEVLRSEATETRTNIPLR